ncbi:MAG: DAK2 domain-containing protein [Dehalococcoidia bacterium]
MTATEATALTAAALRDAFGVAARWLELNRDAINAINVYPVPDGDTGTNMLLTLRAAIDAGGGADAGTAGAYAQACARGALLGARGNSGVILSQMLRGFAAGLDGLEVADAPALAGALRSAADTAYAAVSAPVEGTMLTVMRDAADAAADGTGGVIDVLRSAATEALVSVDRTPQLLPRLREAGVVDSGGLGVAVILVGLRMAVAGEPLPPAPPTPRGAVDLAAVTHEGHGYCTEYVVSRRDGAPLDEAALIAALDAAGGDSILVVGDPDALHVHVHLDDPGPALTAGVAAGTLSGIKIDNMQLQHEAWSATHRATDGVAAAIPAIGVVAVAAGLGIAEAFRALGAVALLADGKPSPAAFLEAARSAGSKRVFLLPNDVDAIMAADQAAREAPDLLTVIPTRSIPAGIAAAVASTPDDAPDDAEQAMRLAIDGVRCIEVTRSARAVQIGGVAARQGQPIALLDGRLAASAETLEDALLVALQSAVGPSAEVVSVYLGQDVPEEAVASLRARIEAAVPALTVELIEGGQPYYPYVAGVE